MMTTILLLIFLSFCIGTGVWLFFIYAVRKGEFDDIEGAKYRMLDDDDEPEPQPNDTNAMKRAEMNSQEAVQFPERENQDGN